MSHKTSFRTTPPQISNDCGVKTAINKSNFPILNRLAIYRLTLNPRCFREPHWHANADELSYCLKGTTLVTIFASGNQHSQFTISEGEMFFAPSGSLHAIENIGDEPAEFLITFSHEMPEDFGISGFAGCLDSSVLGNTWGLAATDISGVTRSPIDIQIGRANGALGRYPRAPETKGSHDIEPDRLGNDAALTPHDLQLQGRTRGLIVEVLDEAKDV
jgi:oxalate decarboxylase